MSREQVHSLASIRAALRAYRSKRTPPHVWEAAREVLIDAGLVSE